MISLNGIVLPSPSNLMVRCMQKGGTAQYNSLGQLVQEGMQEKRHVEIIWNRLPASVLAQLAQSLHAGGFFPLVYPDPMAGNKEISCCASEYSARVWQYQDGKAAWADVKLSLEER